MSFISVLKIAHSIRERMMRGGKGIYTNGH